VINGGRQDEEEEEEEEEEGRSLMMQEEVEIGSRAGSSPLEDYLAQLRSREMQQQQQQAKNGDDKQLEEESDNDEECSDSEDSDEPRPSRHRRGRHGSSTVSVPSSMKLTFCRKCDGLRPPRAHHCMICGRCIMKVKCPCGMAES
jgi:hypothetical protein